MKMMIPIIIFMISCLLFSFSSSQPSMFDFCVADHTLPFGPAGYSCKNPLMVNVNDFSSSGILNAPNTDNIYKAGLSTAFVDAIPGLNGLGISLARVDVQPGGVVPLHTHPDATEVITMLRGNLTVGFISSNNTVYVKSIGTGDVFVIPRGLLHFQVNSGINLSVAIAAFSSSNPNTQIVDEALFKSNLATKIITATTFINPIEVLRLKLLFKGSG
ncbi:hypothetical protein QN277_007635 [Acacia crassicarpa]|uniref:Germin-like protein n=1 Tax=Acacia crassicarpa TaxID=499986 RepID=A0AAE1IV81_9FABA|nr:hypothetical protein QN277_007635 [Acacia crassicarpa]